MNFLKKAFAKDSGEGASLKTAKMLLLDKFDKSSVTPIENFRREAMDYEDIDGLINDWARNPANFSKDLTIQRLSKATKVPKEKLQNFFKHYLGKDFRTWRSEMRIEQFKILYRNEPGTRIYEIADRLGFKDKSNFYKQFKKITGVSPREWIENEAGK